MKNLVVLSDAGTSAGSGISTFCGAGGLWDEHPVKQVATPKGYTRNPELVINFYNKCYKQLLGVGPNDGHFGFVELGVDFNVAVVTQSTDNLHGYAGGRCIIHLYGKLMKVCPSRSSYNPHYIKELKPDERGVKFGDKAGDGTRLCPFTVWSGEPVPGTEATVSYVEKVDISVIIGTLMNVYPVARPLDYVSRKAGVCLIDPKPVDVHSVRRIHVTQRGASKGVREPCSLLQP